MSTRCGIFLLLAFAVSACGTPKMHLFGDGGMDLDAVPVSLSPPGGTYRYRPVVTVVKETTEPNSGVLNVLAPGTSFFLTGGNSAPPCAVPDQSLVGDEPRRQFVCVEPLESGDVVYFLGPTWFSNQKQSARRYEHYEIQLVDQKVQVNQESYTETNTRCHFASDAQTSEKMRLEMTLKTPESFKEWPTATVTVRFPTANLAQAEMDFVLNAKDAKQRAFNSTYQAKTCLAQVDSWQINGDTRGTITRDGFNAPYHDQDKPLLLGDTLKVKGAWSCDGYR